MPQKYIATRLHQALELAPDDADLHAIATKPHYVIDRRLTEMFSREDVAKSITAVIEADVARLPYSELVVEFEAEEPVRRIVWLREESGNQIDATVIALNAGVLTVTQNPVAISIAQIPVPGFVVNAGAASDLDKLAAVFAAAVALLMLNIQGIDKELVTTEALNKARAARGKPSIPRHTILRIGTIIDRLGNKVGYGDGRHMPLHLRAGHVRHQAHGPKMTERKLIYIPPVLVNFKPGDENAAVPQPKRVLTR